MSNDTCFASTGTAPELFMTALNFLAAAQCIAPTKKSYYDRLPDGDAFDFIIVGGGTAGSVVAHRLSEIYDWNILLLEAGPEPPIESDIPYLSTSLYRSKYDWQYTVKGNGKKQQAWRNGVLSLPQGKMLGGSSSINAMIYVKGRDDDYQCWADAGNPSWTPKNVNYYFKKAVNFQDMTLNKDPLIYNAYGHKGPLVVNSFNSTYREIIEKIIESWDSLGIKRETDINTANYTGSGLSGISRVTAQNGRRESTYTAYLTTIHRKNLKIVTNAFVTKILFDDDARAYGVEVDGGLTFYANLEVIVSTGTINTPKLLMLSGIGSEEHLSSKNITCLVDLPAVGQNLKDHLYIPIPIYANEPGVENEAEQMFNVAQYLYNKTGSLANAFLSDVLSFFSRNKKMSYPEFQSHLKIFWKNSSTLRSFLRDYKDDVIDSFVRYNSNKALYIFFFNLLHPFSSGAVYLNTSNPYHLPVIDANYFGDKKDIRAALDGINILRKLVNTTYFKSIHAFIPRINFPKCNKYKFQSDLYWQCYSTQISATMCHPVGTAKMGPDANDSVVDNFLRIHGVSNLRVIDASIMPCTISGNTNAATIMIGEIASDMIKSLYGHETYLDRNK